MGVPAGPGGGADGSPPAPDMPMVAPPTDDNGGSGDASGRPDFVRGQAGRRRVFVPNPEAGSVTVIDTETLTVSRIRAGQRPELVGAHPDHDYAVAMDPMRGWAYVLDPQAGSNADSDAEPIALEVPKGLNTITLDATGTFAVLGHSPAYQSPTIRSGPGRAVSVLTLRPDARSRTVNVQQAVEVTRFTRDGERAYLYGDGGVSRLVLSEVDAGRTQAAAPLNFDDLAGDATHRTALAIEADTALMTLRDHPDLVWIDLETEQVRALSLDELRALDPIAGEQDGDAGSETRVPTPTALALSEDGAHAMASFPELDALLLLPIPGIFDDADAHLVELTLTENHTLHLAPNGEVGVVVDNGSSPPRLTLVDLAHPTDPPRELALAEVANGVMFADDGRGLLLTHGDAMEGADAPDPSESIPGYTLVTPSSAQAAFRRTQAVPRAHLLSSTSASLWVLLSPPGDPGSTLERVAFDDFRLSRYELPTHALGLSEAADAERIVVYHRHDHGRISTVTWNDDGAMQTLTGFNLVNRVRE